MLSTEGLIFGVLTLVFASTYSLCARYFIRGESNPLAFSIVCTGFAALFSLGLFFVEPIDFSSTTLPYVLLLLLSGFLYGIYDATQFSARKYLEASVLSVVLQIAPVIAFLLSIFLLREGVTTLKLVAVGLILLGNIFAIYRSPSKVSRMGLMFGIAMATVSGFTYVIDKAAFPHVPFMLYSFTVYFVPVMIVAAIFAWRGGTMTDIRTEWRRFTWRIPFISVLGVTTYYFLYRTFAVTDASVAVPLTSSATILTVLGGIVLLGEKGNVSRKIFGAILVLAGVLLLRM